MKDKSVKVDGPRILMSGRIKVDGLSVKGDVLNMTDREHILLDK